MKITVWEDKQGWKHASKLRDNDPEYMAEKGIPCEMPDIAGLLNSCARELNNLLVDRGIFEYNDIGMHNNALSNAILLVIRPKLTDEYKKLGGK
jgi:hypothetical protein